MPAMCDFVRLEGVILDQAYLDEIHRNASQVPGTAQGFVGYAIATPDISSPAVDWL